MGFFNDLKEDLAQAVNELTDENAQKELKAEEEQLADFIASMDEKDKKEEQEESVTKQIEESEEIPEDEPKEPLLEDELKAYLGVEEAQEDTIEELEEIDNEEEEIVPYEVEQKENIETKGAEGKMDTKMMKAADETAIITAGMVITGDVSSTGNMDITGTIIGNIEVLGKLNVTGEIQGDSKATEVFAESAKITGEVCSEGSVKIGQSCVIIGNIVAKSAVIAGAVKGNIDVQGPVVLDASAIIMGDIKSKSVQINNGAVIEGMCSQCYADVNPSSFFEGMDNKKVDKKQEKK